MDPHNASLLDHHVVKEALRVALAKQQESHDQILAKALDDQQESHNKILAKALDDIQDWASQLLKTIRYTKLLREREMFAKQIARPCGM